MTYSFPDILLVDFPLTDRSGSKRRPSLVVLDIGDDDVMIAPISSQEARSDYDVEIINWEDAGLALPSLTRIAKLSTIDKMFVRRKLGELQEQDKTKIKKAFTELWEL